MGRTIFPITSAAWWISMRPPRMLEIACSSASIDHNTESPDAHVAHDRVGVEAFRIVPTSLQGGWAWSLGHFSSAKLSMRRRNLTFQSFTPATKSSIDVLSSRFSRRPADFDHWNSPQRRSATCLCRWPRFDKFERRIPPKASPWRSTQAGSTCCPADRTDGCSRCHYFFESMPSDDSLEELPT